MLVAVGNEKEKITTICGRACGGEDVFFSMTISLSDFIFIFCIPIVLHPLLVSLLSNYPFLLTHFLAPLLFKGG